MPKYNSWTKHGEKGVIMVDNEEEDCDDHYPEHAGFGAFDDYTAMEEPEADEVEDDPDDDQGQALPNVRAYCESEKERMKFQKMLEDHRKLLYPDYDDGLKKLGTTLELLQWIKKMLPNDNELPTTTYEAKQLVCPLGLEV